MVNMNTILNTTTAVQTMPALLAYLDPGTGSMVLQVLLAGLLSTSFFLKSWLRQVRDIFALKVRKS